MAELNYDESKETMALLLSYARRVGEVKDEISTLQADIRSIMGEAKASSFKAKHVRMALQMLNAEKEDALVEDLMTMHALMRALNIPAGYQLELFDDRRPLEDKAYQQGWADSAAGKSLNNPYQPGSKEFDAYAKGWHDNQQEARDALQKSMEETNKANAAKAKGKLGGGATPSTAEMIEAQSGNVVAITQKPRVKSNSQKVKEQIETAKEIAEKRAGLLADLAVDDAAEPPKAS